MDQELLQITAVQIIFDLFLIYGLEAFDMEKNGKKMDEDTNDEEGLNIITTM